MSFIEFQSSKDLDKDRQWKREVRKVILEKAKNSYRRKQKREEEAKMRGETSWMLPSIEAKLNQGKSSQSENIAEIMAEKKDYDQNEAERHSDVKLLKRDEWMEATSLFKTYTREEMKIKDGTHRMLKILEEKKRKDAQNKPGSHVRELNPYYKDGGIGLPAVESSDTNASSSSYDATWLRKALARAEAQAISEGRPLEEIAAERWGSLEAFYKLLHQAEGKALSRDEEDKFKHSKRRLSDDRRSKSKERKIRTDKDCQKYEERRERRERRRRSRSNSDSDDRSKTTSNKRLLYSPRDHDERKDSFVKPDDGSSHMSQKSGPEPLRSAWRKRKDDHFLASCRVPEQTLKADLNKKASESNVNSSDDVIASVHSTKLDSVPEEVELKECKTPKEEEKVLSDAEMNQLASRLTKAELMGNEVLQKKLKKKLEKARAARENIGRKMNDGLNVREDQTSKEELVILTHTDASGYTRPVVVDESVNSIRVKRQKKSKTHDEQGQRTSYFPDDDRRDLKAMFEKERNISAEEQILMFSKRASREKVDDDYDVDDVFMEKIAPRESLEKQQFREREMAVTEHRRTQKALDKCHFCLENSLMKKHLIVSLGSKCYVSVPYHQSLTEGHCFIVPIHHVPCITRADEDLWEEIMSYRRAIVKMFESKEEDCVFLEMAVGLRHLPHAVIHCIPLPREVGDMAPIYFKKAIDECDEEWAQNKKLVDLKGRSIRTGIPKGLPYFWVDFGLSPGFAHVIENETKFSRNFGLEIIGGMIDADVSLYRKPRPDNFETQKTKAVAFAEMFKAFDPS